jgi:hypothetical protein
VDYDRDGAVAKQRRGVLVPVRRRYVDVFQLFLSIAMRLLATCLRLRQQPAGKRAIVQDPSLSSLSSFYS